MKVLGTSDLYARLVANRGRWTLAVVAAMATALPFAEGALKNGWIEIGLLAPIVWFLLSTARFVWLQNLIISLIALCVALTGLDLALRPVLGDRLHYTPFNMFTRKLPTLPVVGRWDPNVDFSGEGYGDLAAILSDPSMREPRKIRLQTDAAGFRNNAGSGPIDLVVLGDSFAAGWGTTQEHTLASLLGTRYQQHAYNLSFPSSPWEQYVNFVIESPRLQISPHPNVVWMLFTGNDLDDVYGDSLDVADLPWRKGIGAALVRYRTFRGRSPVRQLLEGVHRASAASPWQLKGDPREVIVRRLQDGRSMLFLNIQETRAKRSLAEVERHENFARLEQVLSAMQRAAVLREMTITVIVLPTKGEIYPWVLEQRRPALDEPQTSGFARGVLGACERAHLRCLDAKPYLLEEARRLYDSTGKFLWWRDDTHINGHGHAALADFVASEVLGMAKLTGSLDGNGRM